MVVGKCDIDTTKEWALDGSILVHTTHTSRQPRNATNFEPLGTGDINSDLLKIKYRSRDRFVLDR